MRWRRTEIRLGVGIRTPTSMTSPRASYRRACSTPRAMTARASPGEVTSTTTGEPASSHDTASRKVDQSSGGEDTTDAERRQWAGEDLEHPGLRRARRRIAPWSARRRGRASVTTRGLPRETPHRRRRWTRMLPPCVACAVGGMVRERPVRSSCPRSDYDPAGITTYSILGADYCYGCCGSRLATVALIVFHEIGVVSGSPRARASACCANATASAGRSAALARHCFSPTSGPCCAELAGISAALAPARVSRDGSQRPVAALVVTALDVREAPSIASSTCCWRCSAVFLTYAGACVLARPDWGAAAGVCVPSLPLPERLLSSSSPRRRSRRGG